MIILVVLINIDFSCASSLGLPNKKNTIKPSFNVYPSTAVSSFNIVELEKTAKDTKSR